MKNDLDFLKVPVLFFILALILSTYHTTFEEWDGVMQYFAGKEIFSGQGYNGWTSHFWPPLSPLLLGFLSKFMPGFTAGKLISILSATITLVFIYFIVIELINDKLVAKLTQFFLVLNPMFLISSIQVENHMLDTSFFIGSIYFLIKFINQPEINKTLILLTIFTGLAALTRYTSYALIPLIIIAFIFFTPKKYILKNIIIFTLLFIFINLPWYYYNFNHNGSPLFTWQYINIGSHIYPGGTQEWAWSKQADFTSISQIIMEYPVEYLNNFLKNILQGSKLLLKSIAFVFTIFIVSIYISRKEPNKKTLMHIVNNKFIKLTIIGYFGYLTLVSQAFVFGEIFLSWTVLFTAGIFIFIFKLPNIKNGSTNIFILISSIAILNTIYTSNRVYKYCTNIYDKGQLSSYKKITQVLLNDKNISEQYIMSIHPARAYYSGSRHLMSPLYFDGTISEFVEYHGIPDRIKQYAPKYPSIVNIHNIKADYLIYGPSLRKSSPQYAFLFDLNSTKIPQNFNLVYRDKETVVYKIEDIKK